MKSLTVVAVLACALVGCGDGSEGGSTSSGGESTSPKEAAQAAVADFLTALADDDVPTACDHLTAAAQEGLVSGVNQLDDPRFSGNSCEDLLQALFGGARAAPVQKQIARFAEYIRSGDVPDGSVTVAIAEDTGTVTLTAGDRLLPIPMELVDDEWLIASASTILFGVGKG